MNKKNGRAGIPPAAAAAAKSLQSCLTLCNPTDGSPPGSPVPGIFQARTLEWVPISFSNAWKWKVKVKSLSRVWLLATPWTAAYQAPLSMGFSRQEYWSGVPLPSPGIPPTSLVIVPLIQSSRQCSQACKAIKTIRIYQDDSLKYEFIYIIIRNEPCFRNMFC